MRYRQYKFKFYLNASHAIYINGNMGEKHPHTWEICMNVLKIQDGFIAFNRLEQLIEDFIDQYQNQFINEVKPFDTLNPTLENCCYYFMKQLSEILNTQGWILLTIEMSETPTRSYVINLLDESSTEQKQMLEVKANELLEKVKQNIKRDE